MRRRHVIAAALLLGIPACQEEASGTGETTPPKPAHAAVATTEGVVVAKAVLAAFAPLPEHFGEPATDAVWQLGRKLYYENRLSKNHDVSCNTCHDLASYGVDGAPTSTGHKQQKGGRNAPTVMNAAGHFLQFWDGRAKDVEKQALGPVLNPIEMALPDEGAALAVLRSMPEYVQDFDTAFPGEGLTWPNVGKAIGAFERKLVTPSRFDKLLAGDNTALTDDEKRGLNTFVQTGCTACHSGALLGGTTFQKVGVVEPWPSLSDKGRFDVTKNEADQYLFKVPSLRNIAKTGPYFHDGSVAKLDEAVALMAKHQLGRELTKEQLADIVTFLGATTGEVDADLVKKPELPPSTDKTPKPDPS